MNTIDTHAHLYLKEFDEDIESVIARARSAGVQNILLPNIDTETILSMKQLVEKDNRLFMPMMGLHPTSVAENWKEQLSSIYEELNSNKYIAIGEIGLDLHWDKSKIHIQRQAFETQLKWSSEKQLPVSMHSRSAIAEVISSIKKVGKENLFGVFHSFGGTKEELAEILELDNFFVGINGVVTFKNSGLKETLASCPVEKIIVETDAPYLAPVPYRGKRNESSYLKEIIKALSDIYNISEIEIANITTKNACNLFNISGFKLHDGWFIH